MFYDILTENRIVIVILFPLEGKYCKELVRKV